MDKGQHLRLFINKGSISEEDLQVVALATEFSFHASASTENSTTKDSTDVTGMWDEFEITSKSYDIQVTAMIGAGTDDANTLNDVLTNMTDDVVSWQMAIVSGTQNRTVAYIIASGDAKITGINPVGQNRQNATYSCTLNGYGPITVAS